MSNLLYAIEIPEVGDVDFTDLNHLVAVEASETALFYKGSTLAGTEVSEEASFTGQSASVQFKASDAVETASIDILTGELVSLLSAEGRFRRKAVEVPETASFTIVQSILARFNVTDPKETGSISIFAGSNNSFQAIDGIETASFLIHPKPSLTLACVEGSETAWLHLTETATTLLRRAIVMNVSNHAVTHYENFNFDSLAEFNGFLLGANENGIFVLDGDLDLTQRIQAEITSGLHDLSDQAVKKSIEGWVAYRTDGAMDMTVKVNRVEDPYVYPFVNFPSKEEARAKPGKGITGRFFKFGLRNRDGSKFSIKSFRVLGDIIRRKTR